MFRNVVDFARDEAVQMVWTRHARRVVNACNSKTVPTMLRWGSASCLARLGSNRCLGVCKRDSAAAGRLHVLSGWLQLQQGGLQLSQRRAVLDALATGVVAVTKSFAGQENARQGLGAKARSWLSRGIRARNRNGRDQQKQKRRKDLNRRWKTRGVAVGGGFWRCVEES